MAKKITIRKLKNIKELVFELPSPGVHLLAGKNGAGKTSLLACLRRIGHRNAFAYHFASSQRSQLLDNFGDAEIVYTLENDEVTYAYAGDAGFLVLAPRIVSSINLDIEMSFM
jgi:predicted ATP-dependent endonuclease of OLD family